MWKNFQGESKVDDKNKDKTVKSVCNPRKAISTDPEKQSSTGNGMLGLCDYDTVKERSLLIIADQDAFPPLSLRREGIFLGE